jgi:glycosyltransferase involved in cell wall biosynthesis
MLIAHTESSHGWGGQEIRILTESKMLISRGHRIILLADPDSLIAQRAELYGVRVHPLRLEKKRLREVFAMRKALHSLKPDIVSTHSSTDHWVTALARLLISSKPAIVRTRHISAPVSSNLATRWLYRTGCEAVVTTGESIRQHLIESGLTDSHKARSVPTGIDLEDFGPRARQAHGHIRAQLKANEAAMIFGNVATLRSWKGHHDLISAFAQISADVPQSRLLIVGDGPQAESLRDLSKQLGVGNRVIFVGHQQDVRQYFDAIDVFVFPSYANEGVPQAILQAMACGLPIITTAAGSIEEAVSDYPAATIVRPQRVDELARAMFQFEDRRLVQRISLPKSVQERINITLMADKMERVYQEVLTRSS